MSPKPDHDPITPDLTDALRYVRTLVDRRTYLERELTLCEISLREAWQAVPHMPVRAKAQMQLEEMVNETRASRMLRAARGNRDVAGILNELFYGV